MNCQAKFLSHASFVLIFSFFLGCGPSLSSFSQDSNLNPHLAPPANIKVLADVNSVGFEWDLPSQENIAGYFIYRKSSTEQSFNKIATLNSRFTTHFADQSLKGDTSYYYQFVSFDAKKNVSAPSSIFEVKTLLIEPVSYVQAISNYPRKVKILWSPHPNPRVTGYIIEKRDNNGQYKKLTTIQNRLLVEYLDTQLQDNSTYTYRIFAFAPNQTLSAPSKEVSASTKPKPDPITNISASKNLPRQILLQWQAHPNPEVIGYVIYRSTFYDSFFQKLQTIPTPATKFIDQINKDGEQYNYKISALDRDGIESLQSEPIFGSTLPKPKPPLITSAKIEGDAAIIHWNPQENRAKEYIVYKKDSNPFNEILRYNKVLTPEFIDREIKPDEKYYYQISTLDEYGLESEKSQEIMLILPKP